MSPDVRNRARVLLALAAHPPQSIPDKRAAINRLRELGYTITRACNLIGLATSTYYHRPRRPTNDPNHDAALMTRIHLLRHELPRAGYRRLTHHLRAQGLVVNPKRIYRLCSASHLLRPRQTDTPPRPHA